MEHNKLVGGYGEDFAAVLLENSGYKIIDRNFRTKYGEIDIIAQQDDTLHFIEVKTRTQFRYGLPAEAITQEKKRHIKRVAEIYMSQNRIYWSSISFDVFEVMTNMISGCI